VLFKSADLFAENKSRENTEIDMMENFVYDITDDSFRRFAQRLENGFAFLRVSKININGNAVVESEHGGMRILCIYRGEGEVFLPKGYRTQEGDGQSLPADQ
jgi:hypothetical protein